MSKLFSVSAIVTVSTLAIAGCASKSTTSSDPAAIEEGSDSHDTETASESLATTFIGGGTGAPGLASASELMGQPQTGELKVDAIGDAAKAFFIPMGCLTVTDDAMAKKATYVFNDCTGPYGLVHVTGTVTVGYTLASASELDLVYNATGLQINKATIDWSATAKITANGLARDMIWDGKFTGTTGRGRMISRTNHKEYKWTVGGLCLGVSGYSDGTVTGHQLRTDVIDFNVCKGTCPEAGSEIKITDETANPNNVYDVKWNANDATYTGPDGKPVNFTPLCRL